MIKSIEFADFLSFYSDVVYSSFLSLGEKTALIEAAHDEYRSRAQPAPYRLIAERLAALPPRELNAPKEEAPPARDVAPKPPAKGPPVKRVAGRHSAPRQGLPKVTGNL